MVFAVLEVADFAIIAVIVAALAGWVAYFRPKDLDRLARVEEKLELLLKQSGQPPRQDGPAPVDRRTVARVEAKVDLLLRHAGLEYAPPPKPAWQVLADEPDGRVAAVKAYHELQGGSMSEAKAAVEAYIETRRDHA
jgi:hypothetical protein